MSLEDVIREIVRAEVRAAIAELAPVEPKLETIRAYAARHSVGVTTVRDAIRDGRLPSTRIGRSVRIPSDATIGKPARRAADSAADRILRKLGAA